MNVLNESNHMMNQMILIIKQPSIVLRKSLRLNRIVFRLGSSLRAKFKLSKKIVYQTKSSICNSETFLSNFPRPISMGKMCDEVSKQELSFKRFLSADES